METKPKRRRAPESPLEQHLGYWMRRVSNHVSGAFAKALASQNASVAEWVVLSRLGERSSLPSELADALGLTRGAISKILDKLEAKAWICRSPHPEDSRMQVVTLTGSGRRSLAELAAIADRNDEAFFGALDGRDRRRLARVLRKLAALHRITDVPLE